MYAYLGCIETIYIKHSRTFKKHTHVHVVKKTQP